MQRVLAQRRGIAGGIILVVTAPIALAVAVSGIMRCQHLWDSSRPTDGDFTTCTVMWQSGCKIVGTGITRGHLQTVLRGSLGTVLSACCVVVRGEANPILISVLLSARHVGTADSSNLAKEGFSVI